MDKVITKENSSVVLVLSKRRVKIEIIIFSFFMGVVPIYVLVLHAVNFRIGWEFLFGLILSGLFGYLLSVLIKKKLKELRSSCVEFNFSENRIYDNHQIDFLLNTCVFYSEEIKDFDWPKYTLVKNLMLLHNEQITEIYSTDNFEVFDRLIEALTNKGLVIHKKEALNND